MSTTPKTVSQLVEEITQAKRDQEAEGKRLADADQQLQALTLWTIPDLVEAIAHGRAHIAPGHDPALTAPTSAREALDLAWDLAHEVKEGQTIPVGTEFLQSMSDGAYLHDFIGAANYTASSQDETHLRTIDPLPDPELDWFDAPAVLATQKHSNGHLNPTVWARDPFDSDRWVTGLVSAHWRDLRDVTPLYPKEDAPRQRTFSFRDDKPWGTKLGGDPA